MSQVDSLLLHAQRGENKEIQNIITRGTSVNSADDHGFTALHWAARMNQIEVVKTLLSYRNFSSLSIFLFFLNFVSIIVYYFYYFVLFLNNISFHFILFFVFCFHFIEAQSLKNDEGSTPLHFAASKGHVEIIHLLVKISDVNEKNRFGDTPLHFAVRWGHVDAVSALKEAGADSTIKNARGDTPIQETSNDRILKILL